MALEWAKKDEFIQAMFRKSHSVHSRRFYEVALRKFAEFCEEKEISEVNDQNVYDTLNRFVEWNNARGIRSKTIIDYLSGTKRFLLYQDVEIDENRYRNKVSIPRVTKIDDQPLTLGVIRSLLSLGCRTRRCSPSSSPCSARDEARRSHEPEDCGPKELDSTPARVHIKAEYLEQRSATASCSSRTRRRKRSRTSSMTLHLIPKRNAKEGGTSPGQRSRRRPGGKSSTTQETSGSGRSWRYSTSCGCGRGRG